MRDIDQGRRWNANWGGVYSYIQVLPDWLISKSTLFQKKLVGHDLNIWIYPPPPINALATALISILLIELLIGILINTENNMLSAILDLYMIARHLEFAVYP